MKYGRGPFLRYLRICVYFGFRAGANCGPLDYEAKVLSTRPWGKEKFCQKKFMYLLIPIDRHYFFQEKALAILNILSNQYSREGTKYESQGSNSKKIGSLKYLVLGCFKVLRGPKVIPVKLFHGHQPSTLLLPKKRGDTNSLINVG